MIQPAEIDAARWRSFVGGNKGADPVRAHAFVHENGDGDGSLSLCGYVERHRTRGEASSSDRRCRICERVIRGTTKPHAYASLPRYVGMVPRAGGEP